MLVHQLDTGNVRLVVKDTVTGAWIQDIAFPRAYTPVALAAIVDLNCYPLVDALTSFFTGKQLDLAWLQ